MMTNAGSNKKELATIRVDQLFAHPRTKVWRMLTEPALLAKWWVPGDIAPVVGHRFTLDMGKWGQQPCTILEVEPQRRLVFSFAKWTVTWRLEDEAGGTRMFLEQGGIDLDDPQGRMAFENMGKGWRDEIMPRIATALAAGAAG